MISRGVRPLYRVRLQGDRWVVDGMPWLTVTSATARGASDAGRSAIAEWLEVPEDAFDVEA